MEPTLLDGVGCVDKVTREIVRVEEIRRAAQMFSPLISCYLHLGAGLITITLREYLELPSTFIQCWSTYQKVKSDHADTD